MEESKMVKLKEITRKEELKEIKKLIKDLKKVYPNIDMNIYRSMYNVNLDTLIGYKQNGVRHFYLENYNESNTEN